MLPNMDPRTLKNMMNKLGIKSSEVTAIKVTIECDDKIITITNPSIIKIEAQGSESFQISGIVSEEQKQTAAVITEDDIALVMQRSGIYDKERARDALEQSKGNIAEAILKLTGQTG